jgi:hypothetical protein
MNGKIGSLMGHLVEKGPSRMVLQRCTALAAVRAAIGCLVGKSTDNDRLIDGNRNVFKDDF